MTDEKIEKALTDTYGLVISGDLGNDIRRELCEKFIESGYDLGVISKD